MQAKKALAVLLALSMTTAPQAVVSASAENATVQENSDVAPEKENSEDAADGSVPDNNPALHKSLCFLFLPWPES